MKYSVIRDLLLIGGLAMASVSVIAGGPSASMLSNTCAGCHGTEGSSAGPASPTIAGLSEEYFLETMKAFKSGDLPSTIMGRIAKGYTADELEAMSKWFAQRPFVRATQEYNAAEAAKGKKLHGKYCENCHEDGGRIDDGNAVLAGQWIPYLRYSMEDFVSSRRDMPKKMKKKLRRLMKKEGRDGIEAIVQYYGSQR